MFRHPMMLHPVRLMRVLFLQFNFVRLQVTVYMQEKFKFYELHPPFWMHFRCLHQGKGGGGEGFSKGKKITEFSHYCKCFQFQVKLPSIFYKFRLTMLSKFSKMNQKDTRRNLKNWDHRFNILNLRSGLCMRSLKLEQRS